MAGRGRRAPCGQLALGHMVRSEHAVSHWSYKLPMVIESGQVSLTGVVKRNSKSGLGFMAPCPQLLLGKAKLSIC